MIISSRAATVLGLIAGYLGSSHYLVGDFVAIEASIGQFMIVVTIISWIEASANFTFAYNIFKTITAEKQEELSSEVVPRIPVSVLGR